VSVTPRKRHAHAEVTSRILIMTVR
jgi:hypothetical protein